MQVSRCLRIMLDFGCNPQHMLTDPWSVQALIEVLEEGALPNLIELILDNLSVDNAIREQLADACRKRRHLTVTYPGECMEIQEDKILDKTSQPEIMVTEAVPHAQYRDAMEYFSEAEETLEDLDDQGDPGMIQEQPKVVLTRGEEAENSAKTLWGDFLDVASEETLQASAMASVLKEMAEGIRIETERENMLPSCPLEQLTPRLRWAVNGLGTIVYTLQRRPVDVRLASKSVIPAVGSHRVYIASLLTNMVRAHVLAVDEAIAKTKVAVTLVEMFFAYENCNSFHLFASNFIFEAFRSKIEALWMPMLRRPADLLDRLCSAEQWLNVPIAKRPPQLGHVVKLSKTLHENLQAYAHKHVYLEFMKNERWTDFVSEMGALNRFLGEQEGCLGGARPEPYRTAEGLGEEGMGSMSSRELLALLSSLGAMRVPRG